MTWQTVFRWDMQSVRRSRLGQGVAATLVTLTGGVALLVALAVFSSPPEVEPPEFDQIMLVIGYVASFILPFVAMLASYSTIIHERERGSVRFLLGLPNSRTEAYVGKYLSRSVLLVVPLVVGLLVAGAIGFGLLQNPDGAALAQAVLVTVVYGLIFLGFGLTISAVFDTETRVTSALIGVYVLFRAGWMIAQWGALRILLPRGERFARPHPEWYYWLGRVNPMNAYNKLIHGLLGNPDTGSPLLTTPAREVSTVATSDAFAAVVLVVWVVVAPLLGYLRFRNRDIL
ncbi:MAG: ABC transporter permease [Haloarculaceae archaeon]